MNVHPRMTRLHFPGTDLTVALVDAEPVRQALAGAIRGWTPQSLPVSAPASAPAPASAQSHVARGGQGFDATSPFHEDTLEGLAPASAACAVIADLAEAFLDARPGHLAVHCGAFGMGGDLVLLTGPSQAGKSTLIARLTAEPDVTIFCDDVLPLDADGQAIGLGIAPRLRLPLPQAASARFRDHVARVPGPRDARYAYLSAANLVPHGTRGRPGTLIVLDRRPEAPARLHRMPPDEALHHLLAQNMGNLGDAGTGFDAARATLARLTCLRLVYADLEEAVALLRARFSATPPPEGRPEDGPALDLPLQAPPTAAARRTEAVDPALVLRHAPGIALRRLGQGAFLWTPSDPVIWHLNPVGHAVWALLAIPGSARDIALTLQEVFPDIPPDRLTRDVAALLGDLRAEGFVTAHAP